MRIASKIGIVLATVALSIGFVTPAEAAKDTGWPVQVQKKYIP